MIQQSHSWAYIQKNKSSNLNRCIHPKTKTKYLIKLNHSIWPHHFMANWRGESGSSLGSKITADGDSSHEISILLLSGRKAMKNPDSVLKNKDIILPIKVHILKAMVFPIVMYGSESWTLKKADRQRINAFKLWCWCRLLRLSWTARRSNQSILKEINCEYSLEGLMLKLKLQYFGHLMWTANSLE